MATDYTDVTVVISYPTPDEDETFMEADIVDEDNDSPDNYLPNISYALRLYKSPNILVVDANSNFGSVGVEDSSVIVDVPAADEDDEFLIFTGSNSASLNKSYKSNFSYTAIGRVYDKEGNIFSPTLTPREGFKEIGADKEIYGVFQVTYKSEYTKYYFQASQTGKMLIFFIGNTV